MEGVVWPSVQVSTGTVAEVVDDSVTLCGKDVGLPRTEKLLLDTELSEEDPDR